MTVFNRSGCPEMPQQFPPLFNPYDFTGWRENFSGPFPFLVARGDWAIISLKRPQQRLTDHMITLLIDHNVDVSSIMPDFHLF